MRKKIMKQNTQNIMATNNFVNVKESANHAIAAVSQARQNIMYFVNIFNKYARKNELCESTDMAAFGKLVQAYSKEHGIDTGTLFNAYLFTKVNGVPCYKHVKHVKAGGKFAITEDIITWQPVKLTEKGVLSAYKYILGLDAKQADKAARAHNREINKAARKAESKEKAAARKALKAEQNEARELFAKGIMCAEQFAAIMAKVA